MKDVIIVDIKIVIMIIIIIICTDINEGLSNNS